MLVLTSNYAEDSLKAIDKSQLIDIATSIQNQIEESWKKLAKEIKQLNEKVPLTKKVNSLLREGLVLNER